MQKEQRMQLKFTYEKQIEGTPNTVNRKLMQYRKIIQYLYQYSEASIAEMVKAIGMSQPMIAGLTDELISYGVVVECGVGKSIGGRRPNLYALCSDYQYVIGVDINLHTLNIALFDLSNKLIDRKEVRDFDLSNDEAYTNGLINLINEIVEVNQLEWQKVLAIGISLPGLVDAVHGKSHTHLSFPEEGIASFLEARMNVPVLIDNDARTMALGEKAFGKAQNKKNVLCLNLSNGIGMGMILNGELYKGKNGYAGEFGHILIDPQGKLCYCGKIGCLETLTSGKILAENITKAIQNGQPSVLAQRLEEGKRIHLRAVVDAILAGDQFAIDQLSQMCEYLGKGLVTLVHLLNPEMIIIGGKLAQASKYIINPLAMAMNKYAMDRIGSETELLASDLLDDAALMGTMANVMKHL